MPPQEPQELDIKGYRLETLCVKRGGINEGESSSPKGCLKRPCRGKVFKELRQNYRDLGLKYDLRTFEGVKST